MSDTTTPKLNKWHIGCQNDETYIINTPPRPITDDPWHDRPDGPTFVMSVERIDSYKIIAEHNRIVEEIERELAASRELTRQFKEVAEELCKTPFCPQKFGKAKAKIEALNQSVQKTRHKMKP